MTSTVTPTAGIQTTAESRTGRVLTRLGGIALIASPLLTLGGNLTSPPQPDESSAGYIASLAADPGISAVSAGLYHYGWITLAFGVLAAIGLVRGPRGRAWTAAAAVIAAFGAMQFSGFLLADHYVAALGVLPPDVGAGIFDAANGSIWTQFWLSSAMVAALLGVPLMLAGLARAGVIGWWAAPVYVAVWVVPAFLPAPWGALVAGLASAPLVVVGLRLIQRANLTVPQPVAG